MAVNRLKKHLLSKKKDLKNKVIKDKVTKPTVKKKVIGADRLRWKPVDIPDTLDDFGGFYGLEELEGVGVEYVDGKPQFLVKEKEESKDEEKPDGEELNDVEMEKSNEPKKKEVKPKKKQIQDQEKILSESVSFKSVELPEDDIDLPKWAEINLSPYTLQGLAKLNFKEPTPIQKKCIPLALQGEDLIGKASTGSGKTLAYGIPILEKLVARTQNDQAPAGVIFTPTRELSHQVMDHLNNISKYFPFSQSAILSLTGGLSIQKQERLLKYPGSGQIVVATPGRFLELIERNEAVRKRFANLDVLVLDEADRLLQDGHFDEFEQILKILTTERTKKDKWQSSVFSATFAKELFSKLGAAHKYDPKKGGDDDNKQIMELLHSKLKFRSKPTFVDLNPHSKLHKDIIETLVECLPAERDLYLYYFLLMYPGTTLVFTNAIDSVKRLVPFLNNLNIKTFAIHSNMIQKQRLKNIENFKKATLEQSTKSTVLIASDVAARGLDIPGIQHVVHYHLPRSADVYIHRSGRTARSGAQGVSVMICSPQEASGPLRNLRKTLSDDKSKFRGKATRKWTKDVPRMPVETDILVQLRERARLSGELADSEICTKSLSKDDNWMQKAADDLGLDMDDMDAEDVFLKRNRTKKENKQLDKQQLSKKRYELKQLLQQQVRKDLRRSYLTGGLQNLADSITKGMGHGNIVGHDKMDALQQLKK
jgi:ATP-dependent RNA helicase DDX24/MAK5